MKYEEIIKLLEAGYSREEIMAMKDEPAPAPDPEPEPEPDPEPKPAAEITAEIMDEVKSMFSEMKKELTAMNIMYSHQDGEDVKTGEDVLANIINPTMRKNGGN